MIVAHGPEADPILFFGNRAALEPVTRDGFIGDYSGIHISATGRRFRIKHATVWNLIHASGQSKSS